MKNNRHFKNGTEVLGAATALKYSEADAKSKGSSYNSQEYNRKHPSHGRGTDVSSDFGLANHLMAETSMSAMTAYLYRGSFESVNGIDNSAANREWARQSVRCSGAEVDHAAKSPQLIFSGDVAVQSYNPLNF